MSANILSIAYALLTLPGQAAPVAAPEATAEAPVAEAPAEDAAAAESETPEADAEAPAEDAAAEEAPAEEAPAEEAEEAPVEEAPVEEAAAEEAPAEEAAPEKKAEEAPGATINPRPEGEGDWLGKHPVAAGGTFKPGTGFIFKTEDDLFSMGVRARIQFRNETEFEDGDVLNTAGIRRARLQFKGNMWGKNNKYKAEFAFSPKDLGMKGDGPKRSPLLSFYSEHTQLRDLSIRLGQYKLLYSRQRVVSSGNQAFVDRSTAQGEFNVDRDIGFHFFSKDLFGLDLFKYYAGMTIGEGRDVWEEENLKDGDDASYQALARFEVLPFGQFKDYSEVDFTRLDKPRMSLGAAFAYLKNGRKDRGYQGSTFADGGTVNYSNMTADVLVKWAGLSLFSEFYWREGRRDNVGDPVVDETGAPVLDDDGAAVSVAEARNGIGGSVQLDYLLPNLPVNVGARYSGISQGAFGDSSTTIGEKAEVGGTVGWFVGGHPLKIQADYFHLINGGGETADRVRVQMQVAY